MSRWYSDGGGDDWAFQWDIEGLAVSRFEVSGAVNRFQTVDFLANLPLEVKRGRFSGKAYAFHQSSHLGDDYIRETGDKGNRYSQEGLRLLFSAEPFSILRFYGGASLLLHATPYQRRWWSLQGGAELALPERLVGSFHCAPYLAQDLQSRQGSSWKINSSSRLGVRIGAKQSSRDVRVSVGYFDGRSPYGQFSVRREHYADLAFSFDF